MPDPSAAPAWKPGPPPLDRIAWFLVVAGSARSNVLSHYYAYGDGSGTFCDAHYDTRLAGRILLHYGPIPDPPSPPAASPGGAAREGKETT